VGSLADTVCAYRFVITAGYRHAGLRRILMLVAELVYAFACLLMYCLR
jgi:hypothetical protein